jgi:Ser/Thr protein kinase RdoA (MazF antagonist)
MEGTSGETHSTVPSTAHSTAHAAAHAAAAASPASSLTGDPGASRGPSQREKFGAEELAVVLSHFEIGTIETIVEFPRGSRRAPKMLVTSDQGKYLLKRRAKGKDDPYRVAFCHAIQLELAARQFPLPHLIGTRRDNNSLLQLKGTVYELFEYIPGQGYPHSLEATFDAGRVLGLFHKLLEGFHSQWQPGSGSYHAAPSVQNGLASLPTVLASAPAPTADAASVVQYLAESYAHAVEAAEDAGLQGWPKQIVHADWHPGNMLFRDNHIVAVIDYDSSRLLPRVIDIANGALQFSIIGGEEDVARWPDYLDESRFKRFLRGYDEVVLLSQAELGALPWLMIEALIAEAVLPIAATGHFGKMDGLQFLRMVQRKIAWMQRGADQLIELAGR